MRRTRFLRALLVALGLVLIVAVAAGAVFLRPAAPMPEALAALASDSQVEVQTQRWLVFQPRGTAPDTGFIFYPGGLVDARAYAPYARAIASQGYLAVIVPMPLNLAVLGGERARAVQQAFPSVRHWATGGHSLGGVMAGSYAYKHPDSVQGVVFWAAYPQSSQSLTGRSLAVASIYATRDGLATPDDIAASRPLLPADAVWTAVEGGNHSQFGWYGLQKGDNEATISRQEQQKRVVEATVALLKRLSSR